MSFKKSITRLGILVNILTGIGAIVSSINDSKELMSPKIAFYGTVIVIFSLIALAIWMRLKKPVWEGRQVTKPNFPIYAFAAGLIFFMWVPVLWLSMKTDESSKDDGKTQMEQETQKKDKPFFPAKFDSTKLYVLVTRFEADESAIETECYGQSIVSRIEEVSDERHLPIIPRYLKSASPLLSEDAEVIRSFHHADLIIWGKIDDADANCTAGGFCMKFIPSDTLLHYTGMKIKKQVKNSYQDSISNRKIEQGLIKMGDDFFDDWLVEMSNLKIGKKRPALFYIDPNWGLDKRHEAYLTRGSIWYSLQDYKKAFEDFKEAISIKKLNLYFIYTLQIAKVLPANSILHCTTPI